MSGWLDTLAGALPYAIGALVVAVLVLVLARALRGK